MQAGLRLICSHCKALQSYKQTEGRGELEFTAGDNILILEKYQRTQWVVGCLDADRNKMGLVSMHFVQFLDNDDDYRALRPKCRARFDNHEGWRHLLFQMGDVILILYEENEKGKLFGCLESDTNRRGYFEPWLVKII